jgi:FtsH-binding integral membrane protein
MFHPTVQSRLRSSLGYFTGGLATTGILVGSLRYSRFAYMNPWLLLATSIGCMIGTQMTSYDNSFALKHALWGGFLTSIALSFVPLINMCAMPIIYDALFATGITMGGLGLVAYNSPSE